MIFMEYDRKFLMNNKWVNRYFIFSIVFPISGILMFGLFSIFGLI